MGIRNINHEEHEEEISLRPIFFVFFVGTGA
jgi:hypothetical protein